MQRNTVYVVAKSTRTVDRHASKPSLVPSHVGGAIKHATGPAIYYNRHSVFKGVQEVVHLTFGEQPWREMLPKYDEVVPFTRAPHLPVWQFKLCLTVGRHWLKFSDQDIVNLSSDVKKIELSAYLGDWYVVKLTTGLQMELAGFMVISSACAGDEIKSVAQAVHR